MPQPTQSDVHVNAILTQFSVAYMNKAENMVAGKIFPTVPVAKQSDLYFVYTKNDWFRDEAKVRADATESAGSGYNLSTASYNALVYAMHKDVGQQTRANADNPLNLDRDATEFVTQRLMLRQEVQWVADYFVTGVWGTSATPTNLWSDYTLSDPIGDVETGKATVLTNTGYEVNTLVLGYDVFRQLKNHPDVVERYKYTSSESITEEMLGALFGIERVFVSKAVKATNVEGHTAAMSFTHGKHALLCYSAPSPSLLAASAGYRFTWTGVSQGMGTNVGVKTIPMPWLEADRIEGQIAFADKIIGSDLGYMFVSVVS